MCIYIIFIYICVCIHYQQVLRGDDGDTKLDSEAMLNLLLLIRAAQPNDE